MDWTWTPPRIDEPELMDAPGLPAAEVAEAYRVLRKVNRHLGNLGSIRREFKRFLAEDGPVGRLSALDVGSGSGDVSIELARLLSGRYAKAVSIALDHDPTAAALARDAGPPVVRGDALRLPFKDCSIDLVTAVKFAHHFSGDALKGLVAEMSRVARCRVIVLDIQRHRLAHAGFVAWSRVFTSNRFVRHDGPLSVLRGFTADELTELGKAVPGLAWEVRAYAPFQLALVGRRVGG